MFMFITELHQADSWAGRGPVRQGTSAEIEGDGGLWGAGRTPTTTFSQRAGEGWHLRQNVGGREEMNGESEVGDSISQKKTTSESRLCLLESPHRHVGYPEIWGVSWIGGGEISS